MIGRLSLETCRHVVNACAHANKLADCPTVNLQERGLWPRTLGSIKGTCCIWGAGNAGV